MQRHAAVDAYLRGASEAEQVSALNELLLRVHSLGGDVVLTLVLELRPELSGNDALQRSRATLLLAELLTRLPKLKLTHDAVASLVQFFVARLQDANSLRGVLMALVALAKNHGPLLVANELDSSIARAVFDELQVQGQPQIMRELAFRLMSDLLELPEGHCRAMGVDWVYNVVRAIDGERDPRNLKIALALLRRVCELVPEHREYAEEIGEVLLSYFPVTFQPPPNDPFGVSRADLVQLLSAALASSSQLAEFVLPTLLDSLTSGHTSSQAPDVGQTLAVLGTCVHQYDVGALQPHVESLWSALRSSALGFSGSGGDEQGAALVCLRAVCMKLPPGASLLAFVEPILNDTTFRLGGGAGEDDALRVVLAVASASPASARIVLQRVVPQLLSKNSSAAVAPLSSLVKYSTLQDVSTLQPFCRALLHYFLSNVQTVDQAVARAAADSGIYLCMHSSLIDSEAAAAASTALFAYLLDCTVVPEPLVDAVRELLTKRPELHGDTVSAMRALNVDLRPASGKWSWLGKVAAACPPLFEYCVAEAEAHLDAMLSTSSAAGGDVLPAGSVCAPFWKALPGAVAAESMALRVLPLVLRWVDALRGLKSSGDVPLSLAVLHAAHAVTRVLSSEQQRGQLLPLLASWRIPLAGCSGALIGAAGAIVGALRPEVVAVRAEGGQVASDCAGNVLAAAVRSPVWDDVVAFGVDGASALCIKLPPASRGTFVVSHVRAQMMGRFHDDDVSVAERRSTLLCVATVARALTMAGAEDWSDFVSWLCDALRHEVQELSDSVADAVAVLLVPAEGDVSPLSRASHCRVRALFRQQATNAVVDALVAAHQATPACPHATSIAAAVSMVIRYAPRATLQEHVVVLLPVLSVALRVAGAGTQLAACEALEELFQVQELGSRQAVLAHVSSLVPALLHVGANSTRAHARAAALRCVSLLATGVPSSSYVRLYPLREPVLVATRPMLDDRKRLVRHIAAVCRNRWYLLDDQAVAGM